MPHISHTVHPVYRLDIHIFAFPLGQQQTDKLSIKITDAEMARIVMAVQHLHSPGLHWQLQGRQYTRFQHIGCIHALIATVAGA